MPIVSKYSLENLSLSDLLSQNYIIFPNVFGAVYKLVIYIWLTWCPIFMLWDIGKYLIKRKRRIKIRQKQQRARDHSNRMKSDSNTAIEIWEHPVIRNFTRGQSSHKKVQQYILFLMRTIYESVLYFEKKYLLLL